MIDTRVIGFFIGSVEQQSKVQLGGFDTYYLIEDPAKPDLYGIHWYPLIGYSWWQIEMKGFSYGGTNFRNDKSTSCILDTGTSLIAIPPSDFDGLRR